MTSAFRHYGPLRPEVLFLAFWAAGVLLPLYPFLLEQDGFSIHWGFSFRDKGGATVVAMLIYSVALLLTLAGMWIGQSLAAPRALHRPSRGLSFPLRLAIVIGIGLLSVLATIMLLGGVGNWLSAGGDRIRAFAGMNFILLLQNGLLAASLAWFIKIARPHFFRSDLHFVFASFSLLALVLVALQGAKSTVFAYLLAMLVVWHVRVHRLPLFRLAVIGAATFVLLMLYHVLKQEYLVVGEFVFYDAFDGFFVSFGRYLFQQLTGNLMQLQVMTVLVDSMPVDLEFQYGETLKMLWLIWVPSALFPDKPLTAPGVFTTAFWPSRLEQEFTSLPPGLFGEFYMNFGVIGVAAGALAFGMAYGIVYSCARRSGRDAWLGVYAVMAGLMLHYFRGELAAVTVLLVSLVVPLVWLLRGAWPQRPRTRGADAAITKEAG